MKVLAPTHLAPLDLPPTLGATVDAIRRIILDTVPGAEERIYKGRTSAGYHDKQVGCFCGVFTLANAVIVEFPKGVRLAKPERILKKGRYIEFDAGARVPKATIRRVIHGALMAGL